ncbi:tRNA-specific 2-thiouridylase [Candidatus Saccharibacteria bacterium]|nr:tRNA-specific 2-thiouridylase [Candidatus Saccharibacteria bacterium]
MKKVFVGMSGGVDSSLSAALLVEAGYDVTGVYMKNWTTDLPGMKCPWAEDLADAKRVAVQLGIPFKVFDFQKEYKHLVVDYMIREYQAGRTPNPDIMCNQEIKFGLFLNAALDDGADMIATGHYAQIQSCHSGLDPESTASGETVFSKDPSVSETSYTGAPTEPSRNETNLSGTSGIDVSDSEGKKSLEKSFASARLLRAIDASKDQTYFLYRITNEALEKTLFPIGHLTKTQVRQEAAKRGLITARKKDSQGICFVGSVGIRDFLSQFVETAPGKIIDQDTGKIIGQHDGAIFYTFGQRHGLSVGGGLPYYVVGKDMKKNEVYVSTNLNSHEFWRNTIELTDVHWIGGSNPFAGPGPAKGEYQIRVRHRAPLIDATPMKPLAGSDPARPGPAKTELIIKLAEPERAIAPGQSIVIYDDQIVLGGGIVK